MDTLRPTLLTRFYERRTVGGGATDRNLSNGTPIGDEMHEYFAQSIAAGRMAADRQRATRHRVRVARGRDLSSRATTALVATARRSARRRRHRRAAAVAVLGPAR